MRGGAKTLICVDGAHLT